MREKNPQRNAGYMNHLRVHAVDVQGKRLGYAAVGRQIHVSTEAISAISLGKTAVSPRVMTATLQVYPPKTWEELAELGRTWDRSRRGGPKPNPQAEKNAGYMEYLNAHAVDAFGKPVPLRQITERIGASSSTLVRIKAGTADISSEVMTKTVQAYPPKTWDELAELGRTWEKPKQKWHTPTPPAPRNAGYMEYLRTHAVDAQGKSLDQAAVASGINVSKSLISVINLGRISVSPNVMTATLQAFPPKTWGELAELGRTWDVPSTGGNISKPVAPKNAGYMKYLSTHAVDAQGKPLTFADITRRLEKNKSTISMIKNGTKWITPELMTKTVQAFPPKTWEEFAELGRTWEKPKSVGPVATEPAPWNKYFFDHLAPYNLADADIARELGFAKTSIARIRWGRLNISERIITKMLSKFKASKEQEEKIRSAWEKENERVQYITKVLQRKREGNIDNFYFIDHIYRTLPDISVDKLGYLLGERPSYIEAIMQNKIPVTKEAMMGILNKLAPQNEEELGEVMSGFRKQKKIKDALQAA